MEQLLKFAQKHGMDGFIADKRLCLVVHWTQGGRSGATLAWVETMGQLRRILGY